MASVSSVAASTTTVVRASNVGTTKKLSSKWTKHFMPSLRLFSFEAVFQVVTSVAGTVVTGAIGAC